MNRRFFVGTAGATAIVTRAASGRRQRATFRTLYSNDTTNITSCISPYHQKKDPITDDRLRASVDEARAADVQLLQPGLGWIPWWKSSIYPADDHYGWLQREYRSKPNAYGRYMLAGGDLVKTFVERCREIGTAPFISFRLNDGHHTRDLEKSLDTGRPSQNMSRFYWENYEKYRIGPDPTDWSQAVFNWAIPAVREQKFAFIEEICRNYDIAGFELDFLRHWNNFDMENTTSEQRRGIMVAFVARVRRLLDETSRRGEHRWLCVRIPAFLELHDRQGVDVAAFAKAGVDMMNLSSSYFTNQRHDLAAIHRIVPDVPLYLEMTHTTMTGKAMSGSGTQPYFRTVDEQFYTTAHQAYAAGAAGVSLFNFVYYRYHVMPELGPFSEPPFHVLPKLAQPGWLASQPQWYFLTMGSNKPPVSNRQLPVMLVKKKPRTFTMELAPTPLHRYGGLLRVRAEKPFGGPVAASLNGTVLEATAFVNKPLDHPYEGYLGQPEEFACFTCPQAVIKDGTNTIYVTLQSGEKTKIIAIDLVLYTEKKNETT